MEQEIRWKQRVENYENAVNHLEEAIVYFDVNPINKVKEGIIQRFEFTHELAWKVMKDFLEYEGITGIVGSRSTPGKCVNCESGYEGLYQ